MNEYNVVYYDSARARWYNITHLSWDAARNAALQLMTDQDGGVTCVQIAEIIVSWDDAEGVTEGIDKI